MGLGELIGGAINFFGGLFGGGSSKGEPPAGELTGNAQADAIIKRHYQLDAAKDSDPQVRSYWQSVWYDYYAGFFQPNWKAHGVIFTVEEYEALRKQPPQAAVDALQKKIAEKNGGTNAVSSGSQANGLAAFGADPSNVWVVLAVAACAGCVLLFLKRR